MHAPSRRAISAALRLVRWPNALTAAAGVVVGAWWAGWGHPALIGRAALAAIGLTVAANTWNDLADIAIDRLAHPDRPLLTGVMSERAADRIAMVGAIAAVLAASDVSVLLGVCSVAVLLLMRLYSPWLKRIGFAGNVVVALLASLPFVYGSYAVGYWSRGVPLVLVAIPLHLARELAKDLDDRDADRGARRTLPLVRGVPFARGAMIAALATWGVMVALVLAPLARSPLVLASAFLPATMLVVFAAARAVAGHRGSPAFFKLAMVCAMAALLVARA
jgi:geranylgeranylglycerol-phosphate geranylgeranyltransferase